MNACHMTVTCPLLLIALPFLRVMPSLLPLQHKDILFIVCDNHCVVFPSSCQMKLMYFHCLAQDLSSNPNPAGRRLENLKEA